MSRDVIKSQWTRLQGKLRSRWSKLTYDDVSFGEGDRLYLTGRLQERYGLSTSAAQLQVAQFERLLF
ncbi:MAG: CsbD family protein [Rudaea sp.]|nr:CsbD family protein [Rudaea sp.]